MARTARIAVAVVLAAVVVAGVWSVVSPDAAPINGVSLRPDGRALDVSVGTCNQEPRVTAVETEDEVRLSSNEVLPRGGSDDCLDHDLVTLETPLGDRTVVDEATGDELEVRPAERP